MLGLKRDFSHLLEQANQMEFKSINPYDQRVINTYKQHSLQDVDIALNKASSAWAIWRKLSFSERAQRLEQLIAILERRKMELASLITAEMGKLIGEAEAEINKCMWGCKYYLENGEGMLQGEVNADEDSKWYVQYQPIGAVLAIMPWNFPFWQVIRFAVPTLLSGNVAILKHAPNVSGCSLALESIFLEAGFAEGVFQSLIIETDLVERVVQDDLVQAVSLTGSSKAGSSVASLAGVNIKKTVLELGGSDPFIILKDADIDKAADIGVISRMSNAGQSCIAAKRIIVVEEVADIFISKLKERLSRLMVNDPALPQTTLAPMARVDLAENLSRQLAESLDQGATLEMGGSSEGCHFEATLLTNVRLGMTAFNQETFGPLACVTVVSSESEAIRLANDTPYGLGASLWTRDSERAMELAKQIQSGGVFINSLMRSDPRMPFGGIKNSGYGRELSVEGIREFVNTQTVYIEN